MAAEPEDIKAVKIREQKARELAGKMRAHLKDKKGLDRYFGVSPDTPIGVIYGALKLLYGQDLEEDLTPSDVLSLLDESHSIYLRSDPR